MPELPEVETIVRDLARLLPGRSIVDVEVRRPDLLDGVAADEFANGLRGREIRGVTRRAKNILIDVGDVLLVVNLGMTGRLMVVDAAAPEPTHLGIVFRLDSGDRLFYQDVRRFGRLQRLSPAAWQAREAAFGPEPLDDGFTPGSLLANVHRSRSPIKPWTMDQRNVVGVGNIYASEALFRAGIDPRRPACSLSEDEALRLHQAIRGVLTEAIEFRGTTLLDYRDASGAEGGFSARLRVYDRAGQPCRGCGTPVERIVQAGRSTFYCPSCQR
jgi:formamidopyrimidine-DNA glycosylase